MLNLYPAGRVFANWDYRVSEDPTGTVITATIDGVVHIPTFTVHGPDTDGQWFGVISLLVAGPDATGNPVGTVVLSAGDHQVLITFPDTPETLIVDGGVISIDSAALARSSGPCQAWEPDPCTVFPDETVMVSGYALEAATDLLWTRTGRRFGVCEAAFRPCRSSCAPWGLAGWGGGWWGSAGPWGSWGGGGGWGWPFPALVGGTWLNLGCGACGDSCSCSIVHQIRLPGPVARILSVKVDGNVLPTSAYRVDDWRLLVRLDGDPWPACNDLNLDDDQPGTWSVTAEYGQTVPALGRLAVGLLAVELAKHMCGAPGCKLPTGTLTELTRQGVAQRFQSSVSARGGATAVMKTGLWLVDLFISTFNPAGATAASIYDMDRPPPRRVGTS